VQQQMAFGWLERVDEAMNLNAMDEIVIAINQLE
jgi:hypothetical protein